MAQRWGLTQEQKWSRQIAALEPNHASVPLVESCDSWEKTYVYLCLHGKTVGTMRPG